MRDDAGDDRFVYEFATPDGLNSFTQSAIGFAAPWVDDLVAMAIQRGRSSMLHARTALPSVMTIWDEERELGCWTDAGGSQVKWTSARTAPER